MADMIDTTGLEDILDDFLADAVECLEVFEHDIKALELRPDDTDLLASAFRCLHSIKGTSGFLGFRQIESLAHAGENLLGSLRDGQRRLNGDVCAALTRLAVLQRELLAGVKATGGDAAVDIRPVCAELEKLRPRLSTGQEVSASGPPSELPRTARPARDRSADTVRVEVKVLDELIDLAGQLCSCTELDPAGAETVPLAGSLYAGLIAARVQELDVLWRQAERIAHDLATECGKSVDVVSGPAGMHIDRRLGEALIDPLVHMIRNAVDHGIESPTDRLACGKPAAGRLRLEAQLSGAEVIIEVGDDGAGIDLDRVRRTALEQNVASPAELAAMTDADVSMLILRPGFSTTERITRLSGRGVGMDVVRSKVEGQSGTIELLGGEGRGTVVRMRFPLTIALLPTLTLYRGDERFAIPFAAASAQTSISAARVADGLSREPATMRWRGKSIALIEPGQGRASTTDMGASKVVVARFARQHFGILADRVIESGPTIIRPGSGPGAPPIVAISDGSIPLLDLEAFAELAGINVDSRGADSA